MGSRIRRAGVPALIILWVLMGAGILHGQDYERVVSLKASADLPFQLREALIMARPGTEIRLPEGHWKFDDELILNTSHVTLKGQGADKTVLSFAGQPVGAQGLLVLSDAFVLEDLAIEDTAGDGLRVEGANGVIIRRVRVEWTRGAHQENGSYGIYPVLCENILVEETRVSGASDAGIYVGQSKDIVVRRNTVEYNVAGIEIENSVHADVYENEVRHNTGGILIFDMPALTQAGHHTRVFRNRVVDNNTKNFAPPGNIVGKVPAGTGIMVLSTDHVDVFENIITGNRTVAFAIVSFKTMQLAFGDRLPERYDPYPEHISFHHNIVSRPAGWYSDGGELSSLVNILFLMSFRQVTDIVTDGWTKDGPENASWCFYSNRRPDLSRPDFGNLNMDKSHWLTEELGLPGAPAETGYQPWSRCRNAGFGPAQADASVFADIPDQPPAYSAAEIAALCQGGDPDTVNWPAFVVDCPRLSDYRLFADPADARGRTNSPRGLDFAPSTPLFTDHARKDRFVFVPPGEQARYREDGPLDFPVGTFLVKTFTLPLASGEERTVETRLLIRREEGWKGLPYIYGEPAGDAVLSLGGGRIPATVTGAADDVRVLNYRIPDGNQCTSCHGVEGEDQPIGPRAAFLNHAVDVGGSPVNQLLRWQRAGILQGVPEDTGTVPRQPVWNDPDDGDLEGRARAYLDMNCAHCHSVGGRAHATGLYLGAGVPLDIHAGICKPPVAAGRGAGDQQYAIVPGRPEASILVRRMDSDDPAVRMPEIGRSVVNQAGVDLVSAWISSLSGDCGEAGTE